MSEEQSVINRYNFSRRVVDHRQPYDLNHAINKAPLTPEWYKSTKQRFISKFVQSFAVYSACIGVFAVFGLGVWDAYAREGTDNPSVLFHPKQQWGQNYLWNHKNADTDLGKWNHNFYCWERSPNCGRDFD
ncbi:hypothetical protein PPERSA_05143 [Pseudocohnilembus persalinus]|uniref:Uncharacterized protein n=1 Tax=Pseudocohnilembus persalinus TaxID=266149 RepID=A0A0V0QWC3_PSEPJ|nr:hypothetical protein PPERSA_05143 [Pseudocohnilembus persalinus]|eukprot:KRX06530.1 hypothetical protein PPERSA_05143 [Pseudocohnilembus persalinus]